MRTRPFFLVLTLILVIGASALAIWKIPFGGDPVSGTAGGAAPAGEFCGFHQIPEADCPWCDPSLLVSKGFCRGHGVPEALCVRCDPRLEAGFRAENDWCAGHSLPESQCLACGAVLPDPPAEAAAQSDCECCEEESCETHRIPEADCPWCDPSLLVSKGFCRGHGVPEALCVRCDPRLEAGFRAEKDWCAGHSLPESQCLACGAVLPGPPAAPGGSALAGDASNEAGAPRALRAPEPDCVNAGQLVQLASAVDVRATGIELGIVVQEEVSLEIERNAALAFDGDRHAQLGSRTPGVVARVLVDLGQRVEAGQELLLVDSALVGEAKSALLRELAMVEIGQRDRDREARLLEQGAGTERQALEAETRLAEAEIALVGARQRLRSLGLDELAIERVAADRDSSSLLPLRAPFAGTVVERRVALGQSVAAGEALLEIADLSRMWLRVDLLEQDAGAAALGRGLSLEVDALPGQRWSGELDWVGAGLDPRSRTLPARAVIPNPDGRLRAGMYGRATIRLRDREPSVLVAKEAVQWEGCCNIVFLPEGPASFRPRPVSIAYAHGDRYVVHDGLRAGEQVVTTGAFLLKTEILKGSIGAGCCETEAPKR